MKGKIAVVTGANGGLGSHVTQGLLDAGATVIGVSRNIQQSAFSSDAFTALSAEISTCEGARNLVERVVSEFGRIDVAVHTIGGFAGGQNIADLVDSTFQQMLDLNLYSTFYLLRAILPVMRKTGNGRIVAVGRRGGGEPGAGVGGLQAPQRAKGFFVCP